MYFDSHQMNKWADREQRAQLISKIDELNVEIKKLADIEEEQEKLQHNSGQHDLGQKQVMTPDAKAELADQKNDLEYQRGQLRQQVEGIDERLELEKKINRDQKAYERKHDIVKQTQELKRLQTKIKRQQAQMMGGMAKAEMQS